MSLKPKKHSEKRVIQEKLRQKVSRMETRYTLPPYILIVSEGIKTEPLYLRGFAKRINSQYKSISKEDHIVVYGTGRNTKGLLDFVDKEIEDSGWGRFNQIWLVYDKDDFPLDNFDNTQFAAEGRKCGNLHVAWSNESIELWFLLHFQDYHADNGRKQYIEKLKDYFDYTKTREDLYEIVNRLGSLEDAKRRAKKMYLEFVSSGETSPSAMVPATRMFELIEELEQYIH